MIIISDINDNYNQLRIVFHRVIIMKQEKD